MNAAPSLGPTCMKEECTESKLFTEEFLCDHTENHCQLQQAARTHSSCQSVLSHMLLKQSRYFYPWHRKVSGTFSCCHSCPHPAGSVGCSEQGTSGTAGHSGKQEQQPGPTAGAAGPPSLVQLLQACKDLGQDQCCGGPGALITNRRL